VRTLPLIALAWAAAPVWAQSPAAAPPATAPAPAAAPGLSQSLSPELAVTPEVVLRARIAAPEAITFEQAVDRALAQNPSALVAAQEIMRAEGLMAQARATALPNVTVQGIYTLIDHDRILAGRLVQPGSAVQGTATLAVPLVAVPRWYAWAHGVQGVDAAAASNEDVRRSVAITAARIYLTVVATHRAVEVSESAAATGRAHEEFALARRQGGVGNELDVKRAEQERWAAEVQVQAAYAGLARGREALGVICGAAGPLDSTTVPTPKYYPDLAQAEDAVQGRQDVQAAASRFRLFENVWKDSWSDWMPVLTGSLQGYLQDPAVAPTPPSGWVLGLVLTLPIYEGGLRPGQSKEREAISNEAQIALEGVLRQARSEVRVSFEAMRYAVAGYDAARKGAQSAAKALELANIAYRAGATSNLDVIDAERRARDAATVAVISEDAVRQANLDLLSAAGRFPPR
jgi:outer membrane protein TolC